MSGYIVEWINTVEGAQAVLEAIDFSRLSKIGVGLNLEYHLSDRKGSDLNTLAYRGPIVAGKQTPPALPKAEYPNQLAGFGNMQEARWLNGQPSNVDFYLSAAKPSEFEGLSAFARQILPQHIYLRGYAHANPDHWDIMKLTPLDHPERPLMYLKPSGLYIFSSPGDRIVVNGRVLFDKKDIETIMKIEPKQTYFNQANLYINKWQKPS